MDFSNFRECYDFTTINLEIRPPMIKDEKVGLCLRFSDLGRQVCARQRPDGCGPADDPAPCREVVGDSHNSPVHANFSFSRRHHGGVARMLLVTV